MRNETRVTFSILIAIALLLVNVGIVYAHLYGGYRWQANTVQWYIGGGGTTVPSGWYSQYRASASTWSNAAGSFTLSETSPTIAQANLGAKYFSQDPNIPDGAHGFTFGYTQGGYLVGASTYLNRDYTWVTNGSSFPDVRTVATHELGHWVYYIDSCAAPTSVMCAQAVVKWNLTAHDQNELVEVYP